MPKNKYTAINRPMRYLLFFIVRTTTSPFFSLKWGIPTAEEQNYLVLIDKISVPKEVSDAKAQPIVMELFEKIVPNLEKFTTAKPEPS